LAALLNESLTRYRMVHDGGLFFDIAVTHPLNSTVVKQAAHKQSAAARHMERVKKNKYDDLYRDIGAQLSSKPLEDMDTVQSIPRTLDRRCQPATHTKRWRITYQRDARSDCLPYHRSQWLGHEEGC
jgi:hypothetical protein